ncbi:MAG: 4Fe-4S binding protein [Clostridiales bacterium]|nr:4Fe-4S binding protein [Clostridiales bacterium]
MKTTLFSQEIQSPIIIGSGPLSFDADGMIALDAAGAGAVVTKTIRRDAADNAYRHMAQCDAATLINCEKWSDDTMETWLRREIPKAVAAGVKCIASIGHTVEDSRLCAEELEAKGCLALELVSYREETILPMLEDTRKRVNLPVIVKLSPNWPDLAEFVKKCEACGADAFTACDSMGPALKIDIETGKPVLGGADGYGWLSGAMIRPFTLQKVCEIRKVTKLPIIGLGGVTKWQDAVEMLMAGADYVGMCSAPILYGAPIIGKIDREIDLFLEKHQYADIHAISGIVQKYMPNADEKAPFEMEYDAQTCSSCGRCVTVCPYHARTLQNRQMWIRETLCRKCGLCVSVCKTGSIWLKESSFPDTGISV